jgi:hypothetical protein
MPKVECPHCCANLNAPAEHEGHTVKCGTCRASFVLRFTDHTRTIIAVKVSDHRLERPANDEATTEQFALPGDPTATFRLPASGEPPSAASKAPKKPCDKPFPEPPVGRTPG